jgi:hypothetical protein
VGCTARRRYAVLGAACASALVAGAIVAGLVLAFGGSSQAAPTKEAYFARVAAICRVYGPKLDKVPAPADIAAPGDIVSSVEKALPVLQAEARALRKLRVPDQLGAKLARWLDLNDRSIAKLRESLRAAHEPNVGVMGIAYTEFLKEGSAAEQLGRSIGFPRPPC